MGRVISNMSVSVDGIVNAVNGGAPAVFGWMGDGPVEFGSVNPAINFAMSEQDARYFQAMLASIGAIVGGRRLFEEAQGWNGTHPAGVWVVILTHQVPSGWPRPDSAVEFVTDGEIAAAVDRARERAGEKDVVLASPDIVRQALTAGLLDEITLDLVPVLVGAGRHYFEDLGPIRVALEDPQIIPGDGVTHLRYRLRR